MYDYFQLYGIDIGNVVVVYAHPVICTVTYVVKLNIEEKISFTISIAVRELSFLLKFTDIRKSLRQRTVGDQSNVYYYSAI